MDTIRCENVSTAAVGAAGWRFPGWAAARKAVEVLSLWRDRAGQRRALAALDDRLLKDIGLSRADAEREAVQPFWRP